MTTKKPIDHNFIWRKFFIRSANAFMFDLKDQEINLQQFSVEDLYNLVAILDNILVKGKIFKEELIKRVNNY